MRKIIPCLLLVLLSNDCWSQTTGVDDLTEFDSAASRLENYFNSASAATSSRTIAYRLHEASYYAFNDSHKDIIYDGLKIVDDKLRLLYACTQRDVLGDKISARGELLRFGGVEKGKAYGAVDKDSNSFSSQVIPPDKESGERLSGRDIGVFYTLINEIDPYGLAVAEPIMFSYRHSEVHNVASLWTKHWQFFDERQEGEILFGRWKCKNASMMIELQFDNKSGGMPSGFKSYYVDKNEKQIKGPVSTVKTTWMKSGNQWIPVKILSKYVSEQIFQEFSIEFQILRIESHERLLREVDWKSLHDNDRLNWFNIIGEKVESLSGAAVVKDE